MRGFTPRRAKEQKFADGGFVTNVKRMFGMDAERNAQIAEYRARSAAEKAQAQQSAQPAQAQPQQRAVSDYSGMSATQRREKELGLKDGGRVHPRGFVQGPGTGTSDSIKARLSNGEYVLPADTVQAVGVQALDELKDATHMPARGFTPRSNATEEPRHFFADGGAVQAAYDDWQSKKQPWYMPTPRGNMEERTAEANYSQALQNQLEPKPAAPPAATTQNATDVRLAFGTMGAPGAAATGAQPPKPEVPGVPNPTPSQGREVVPGVYSHGRGQYSDDPTGMNMPAGFTGQPSAANNAILERMSDKSKAESMARVMSGQQPQPVGFQAPTVRHSGNDWQARNDLRNAEVSAGSILNTRKWGGPGAENNPDVLKYKAMLAADNAARGFQPGLDQEAMRQNGSLQREGMQQTGETQRTGIRAALDQQRINQSGQELGLRTEAAGFQTRSAKRLEDAQLAYEAAKTPEEKASIAQRLRDLQGKEAPSPYDFKVSPAIRNADGSTTEGSAWRFNRATGQAERVDGGQQARPSDMPPSKDSLVVGQVYQTARGAARWNGKAFDPV